MGLSRGVRRRLVAGLAAVLGAALLLAGGTGYMLVMPGQSYRGQLPPLTGEEADIRDRLVGHVRVLAGEIGERNAARPAALQAAARYIEQAFEQSGLRPARQDFPVEGFAAGLTASNIEAQLPGGSSAAEIVVVGAHYDSVIGCPGANDNASGVAAVLEIARILARRSFPRTIRFAAFANEEPPFFKSGQMGSRVYARRCRQGDENIVAMLSLETIGCYSDQPASQSYPFPLSLFYPDTGNFIAFVGSTSSRDLVCRAIGSFRRHARFPSEGGAPPGFVPGIDLSDHWSFWQEGYPAIMVTDTAPYRYQHYHTPDDTPDKLDYDRMARVTAGLARVVADLAGQ